MDSEINDEVAKAIGHLVLANVSLGVQLRRASAPAKDAEPAVDGPGTER